MVDILLAVSQCPHCGLDGHRLVVTRARKVLESYSLEIKCSTCNKKRFAPILQQTIKGKSNGEKVTIKLAS